MDLTMKIKKNGDTKYITKEKQLKKMIKESLNTLKDASFNGFEAETSLNSLLPFVMSPQSIAMEGLVVDYYQTGNPKDIRNEMKKVIKRYISHVSFA